MEEKNIYQKLTAIQNELKAPKNQYNSFGNYKYRSCEDILEALKPLLEKHNLSLFICDAIEVVGDRHYIKATCTLAYAEQTINTHAYAREEENKKGMDGAQVTGASSSYARKYALNGLFLIDDTKDADTNENREEKSNRSAGQNTNQSKTAGNISEKQITRLYAIANECGFTKEDVKKAINLLGKAEAKNLTKLEYDNLIARMEKRKQA